MTGFFIALSLFPASSLTAFGLPPGVALEPGQILLGGVFARPVLAPR
ncbi:hypothetical protein [Ralstonia solanacearum]|nr:hypothetical protein [Ralstonia solanacearum]